MQLAKDLQENLFDNECGEDAHEVIRLVFRRWFDSTRLTDTEDFPVDDAIAISQKNPHA